MPNSLDISDPRRRLALAYAPQADRLVHRLLWSLDERLGAIVAGSREPMLGQIRLTWWRDALSGLADSLPRGEPLLGELSPMVASGRVTGSGLAQLAEGWMPLLSSASLDEAALIEHARLRGAGLFRLAAGLEQGGHALLDDAGMGWALADIARRVRDPAHAALARRLADAHLASVRGRWSGAMRPLALLTCFARDERAIFRGIWAGLTGRC